MQKVSVLDHGYVLLVDVFGSDKRVVNAARTSYDKAFTSDFLTSSDISLLRYLLRHRHTTPFEMCSMTFEIKLPISVARQLIRHRTAKVNEYSTRYTTALEEVYLPEKYRAQAQNNKQGSDGILPDHIQEELHELDNKLLEQMKQVYKRKLELGVSREQARDMLPLANYTKMVWTMDLHNLFHFLKLRTDSHAQWEIRQYAFAIASFVKRSFPESYIAWVDYVQEAIILTKPEQNYLQTGNHSVLSPRELEELRNKSIVNNT